MMEKDVNTIPRFEILTPTGWSEFKGIRSSLNKTGLVTIHTSSGKTLTCTNDHLIKTDGKFISASKLKIGDCIDTKDGLEKISNYIQLEQSNKKVYDAISVKNENEYYTNGIISHNCAWLGSSGTLISGAVLKTLVAKPPLASHDGLNIYKEKDPSRRYSIVVDVSRGKGLDYSAFQVIDITEMPYEQVCTFKNNMITPLDFSSIIHRISKTYNNATILVEINDIGGQVADSLYFDYENENIIFTENAGARGKRISAGFSKGSAERGIRTTKTVKSIGCSMLKLLIEQRQLIINDHNTIHELSRFSKKGTSYEAETGCNDDLVMCLVLFAWMSDQQYFKELTDINTLNILRDKTDEELENELTPFGFMDDGHPEEDVIDLTQSYRPEFNF